jgi:hypothetical protein
MYEDREEYSKVVVAMTNKTFLEFCEISSLDPLAVPAYRPRLLSSFLRRVATEPDLVSAKLNNTFAVDPNASKGNAKIYTINSAPSSSAPVRKRREPLHKVFVGGLSPITDEASLFNFMMRFGAVKNLTVKRNPVTGQSRRYAFVKFFEPPSSWIFDQPWIVDDHPIRISRYQVSSQWKHHFYSEDEE